ncbi:N-acetylneuraminate synthase family protein [Rhodohalobacter sulfatireducens]|uniref:N-acetylneuraminate synthase family protein n=1 Tax=Rhodohalobacter sulfatireducens TaxID=2911366 RepID=A0ABS9KII3_9BACT|nr:N-acetylneuraminate synthase family protein [Rhodohalobacter sulfatireducens]MCG2590659.1 N-acetylneuraminate synthase family protein [Rhodohalobacter sulfatireducens]
MKEITINSSLSIGGEKTFVIAEIGSNHNQSLEMAFETIDAAKDAGADAVKFQSLNREKLYYDPTPEIVELYNKIDLEEDWHYKLDEYCKQKDILFFSSPTYLDAVDILEDIEVPIYKLASAQIGSFPQIIERVANLGKPVILSTGLVTYGELDKVMQIFKKAGNEKICILHCNSIYPTPFHRVHLPIMNIYKTMYDVQVGFSDHTPDVFAPVAAVTMGAKVIEKHFTLSKDLPVPDAPISIDPDEFKRMVEGIRAAEQVIKPAVRMKIEEEEKEFKDSLQMVLVTKKGKKKGDTVEKDDFRFLRHSEGINCKEIDTVLNKKYTTNIDEGTLLQPMHIG